MNKLDAFKKLSEIFVKHGYMLYLVGGSVRDYLFGLDLDDMDVVTDATPDQMKDFIDGDYTFSHLGCVKYKFDEVKFDITTLRKEKRYKDARHPNNIKFVTSLKKDYKRRDFSINAMYMSSSLEIIDYVNGQNDIKNKTLKMVGCPYKRIKEDPLRIIRGLRFAAIFDLKLDKCLEKAIIKNLPLLEKINKQKVMQEIKKVPEKNKENFLELLNKFSIKYLLDMIH